MDDASGEAERIEEEQRRDEDGVEYVCRICFCEGTFVKRRAGRNKNDVRNSSAFCTPAPGSLWSSSGGADERLIRPCLCKGTMSYVHVSCLNRFDREACSCPQICSKH